MDEEYEYDDYDEACEEMIKKNESYLTIFIEDLSSHGISENTVNRHIFNVDMYINTYLLRYDVLPMQKGTEMIDDYLGDFFIRKCMWSSHKTIKTTAASIKKFYKCMMEHGFVSSEDYKGLCADIKKGMDGWQTALETYELTYEDSFFLHQA